MSAERFESSASGRDLVSVVLPYYDREDVLLRAAMSVLNQTHDELLLYLVNDGSTDCSRDIARSIEDDRVRHLDSPGNAGACIARNLGLATARTELVAFMDSDDVWLPEKLERQVAHLRRIQETGEMTSVLGCGWRYANRTDRRSFPPGPFTRSEMLRGVAGTSTQVLLVDRSRAAEGAAFDPSFVSLEERDFVLSCLANDSLLRVLPDVLVEVTRGREDHLANPVKAAAAWERYLTKYRPELAHDDELLSWYHFRAGREHLVAGDRRSMMRHVREAVRFSGGRRLVHLGLGSIAGVTGVAVAQKVLPL